MSSQERQTAGELVVPPEEAVRYRVAGFRRIFLLSALGDVTS